MDMNKAFTYLVICYFKMKATDHAVKPPFSIYLTWPLGCVHINLLKLFSLCLLLKVLVLITLQPIKNSKSFFITNFIDFSLNKWPIKFVCFKLLVYVISLVVVLHASLGFVTYNFSQIGNHLTSISLSIDSMERLKSCGVILEIPNPVNNLADIRAQNLPIACVVIA